MPWFTSGSGSDDTDTDDVDEDLSDDTTSSSSAASDTSTNSSSTAGSGSANPFSESGHLNDRLRSDSETSSSSGTGNGAGATDGTGGGGLDVPGDNNAASSASSGSDGGPTESLDAPGGTNAGRDTPAPTASTGTGSNTDTVDGGDGGDPSSDSLDAPGGQSKTDSQTQTPRRSSEPTDTSGGDGNGAPPGTTPGVTPSENARPTSGQSSGSTSTPPSGASNQPAPSGGTSHPTGGAGGPTPSDPTPAPEREAGSQQDGVDLQADVDAVFGPDETENADEVITKQRLEEDTSQASNSSSSPGESGGDAEGGPSASTTTQDSLDPARGQETTAMDAPAPEPDTTGGGEPSAQETTASGTTETADQLDAPGGLSKGQSPPTALPSEGGDGGSGSANGGGDGSGGLPDDLSNPGGVMDSVPVDESTPASGSGSSSSGGGGAIGDSSSSSGDSSSSDGSPDDLTAPGGTPDADSVRPPSEETNPVSGSGPSGAGGGSSGDSSSSDGSPSEKLSSPESKKGQSPPSAPPSDGGDGGGGGSPPEDLSAPESKKGRSPPTSSPNDDGGDGGGVGDGGGGETSDESSQSLVETAEGAPDADNSIVQQRLNQAASQVIGNSDAIDDRGDFTLRVTDTGRVEFGGLTQRGREDAIEQDYRDRGAEDVNVDISEETSVSGRAGDRLVADQSPTTETQEAVDVNVDWGEQPDQVSAPDGEHAMTSGEDTGPAIGTDAFTEGVIEARVERQTDQDVTVETNDDGSVTITDEGGDVADRTGGVATTARAVRRDLEQQGQTVSTDEEFQQVSNAQEEAVQDYNPGPATEQFGDVQVGVPGTDKTAEEHLESASSAYQKSVRETSDALFDEGGVASESIIAEGLEAAEQDEAADAFEEGLRSFGKGTFEGAAAIGNVPGVALGVKEGGEIVGYGVSETYHGRGGEALEDTKAAAATAVTEARKYAVQNPVKFSGLLAGSLAGSYTAMSGTAKISSRAGKATRYAIQPGEELATGAATKVAQRTATGQRALNKIPGGRIDNEELALYAGQKAVGKTRDAAGRVKAGVSDTASRVSPDVTVARNADAPLIDVNVNPDVSTPSVSGKVGDTADAARGRMNYARFAAPQRARKAKKAISNAPGRTRQTTSRLTRNIGEFKGKVKATAARLGKEFAEDTRSGARVPATGPDVDTPSISRPDVTGTASDIADASRGRVNYARFVAPQKARQARETIGTVPRRVQQTGFRAKRTTVETAGEVAAASKRILDEFQADTRSTSPPPGLVPRSRSTDLSLPGTPDAPNVGDAVRGVGNRLDLELDVRPSRARARVGDVYGDVRYKAGRVQDRLRNTESSDFKEPFQRARSRAGEFSVRVDFGKPNRQRVLTASELGDADVEFESNFDTDSKFGPEQETGRENSGYGDGNSPSVVEVEQDTRQATKIRVGMEREAPVESETSQRRETPFERESTPRYPSEVAVSETEDGFGGGTESFGEQGTDPGFNQDWGSEDGTQFDMDPGLETSASTDTAFDQSLEFGPDTRTSFDAGQDFESGARTDTELATEFEFEGETEIETGSEYAETELEWFGDENKQDGKGTDSLFSSNSEVFDTGVVQSIDELSEETSGQDFKS